MVLSPNVRGTGSVTIRKLNFFDAQAFTGREVRSLNAYHNLIGAQPVSLATILIILLIIFLLGGFSGRFGGYGYGFGHTGMGIGGVLLVVLIVLLLTGRI
jgi:hypothetical protein